MTLRRRNGDGTFAASGEDRGRRDFLALASTAFGLLWAESAWAAHSAGLVGGHLERGFENESGFKPASQGGARSQERKGKVEASPHASASPEGLRVLILGDSMIAGAFGLFLERKLRRNYGCVVQRFGKSATGLARPDFFDWIEVGPPKAKAFLPDAVVTMFGGNDAQALRMGRGKGADWIRWGKAEWEPTYRARIREFADQVAPVGTRLFWVGMPVMRPKKLNARVQFLNGVYREEMQQRAQSDFIDIWPVLSDAKGEYTDRVKMGGRRRLARAGDGVHLTVRGAHHLVGAVAPEIAAILGLSTGVAEVK